MRRIKGLYHFVLLQRLHQKSAKNGKNGRFSVPYVYTKMKNRPQNANGVNKVGLFSLVFRQKRYKMEP